MKKHNIRDLSYLSVKGKPLLARERVFRGAAFRKLSKKTLRYFSSLPLTDVIDLRTPGEIMKKPDIHLAGVSHHEIPLLDEATIGITHEKGLKGYKQPPVMPDLYAKLVTDPFPVAGIKKAIHVLLDPNRKGAIYVHCTAGKDRSGIVMALFEYACGVSLEDIYADYQASNPVNEKKGKKYAFWIRTLLRKKELAKSVLKAMQANKEYLDSAFNAIKEKHGSIDAFLRNELEVTPEEVAAFLKKNQDE